MRLIRIISAVLLLDSSQAGFAACVLSDYSVQAELDRSTAVILGTLMAERATVETKNFLEGVTYTVRVHETLHGPVAKTVELFSENSSGRFPMEKKKTYILFIHRALDRLAVDNCGNSGLVTEKKTVLSLVRQLAKVADEPRKPN
jgi:hypothetical protein